FFLLLISSIDAFKILVFKSKFAHSHSKFMGVLADTLQDAGHEVVSLMPVMDPSVPDYTTTKIIRIERVPETQRHLDSFHELNFFTLTYNAWHLPWTKGRTMAGIYEAMCDKVLDEPGLIEMMKDEKFDVMLNEGDACGIGDCNLFYFKKIVSIKVRKLKSTLSRDIGIPLPLSYVQSLNTLRLDPHSMWSRAMNWINHKVSEKLHDVILDASEKVFKKRYGPSFPDFSEIMAKSALIITNQEPVLSAAHPSLKKIIDLGGIVASESKPLDERWLSLLSLRSRTVLVSFGSVARSKTMPEAAKKAILTALPTFPNITFIWKYETPEDDFATEEVGRIDNIVLTQWVPQNDLLGDDRVVAFVSHGGADQPYNAAMMAKNGMAVVYDKFDLNDARKLTDALR
ncbi:hypothetical protein PFISCL1PPCAC_13614, partial [Pristionchus fissidentatus]